MTPTFRSLLPALALVLPATSAVAAEGVPLYVRNDNPFVAVYGFPHMMPVDLPPAGEGRASLNLNVANNSVGGDAGSESITLDGETWRLSFGYSRALTTDWGVEVELPYVRHTGGGFDGFIRDWHDLFGLSNTDRDQFVDGELQFQYVDDGVVRADITEAVGGLGDVRLGMVHRLWEGDGPRDQRLVGRFGVKLPTGDEQKYLGSGAADIYVSLDGVDQLTFSGWNMAYWVRAGVVFLGEGEIFADRQKDAVVFAGGGVGWSPWAPLELKGQMEIHSAYYDSALDQLGDVSTQVTAGGTLTLPDGWYLDAGVMEQFATDTLPDVIFHLALRQGF